jgi:short-subunit dehydrogenase
MDTTPLPERPLAVVTGGSSAIGYELARRCAEAGFDVLTAADQLSIVAAAAELRAFSVSTAAVRTELATRDGVERLIAATAGRPIAALLDVGRLREAAADRDGARRHVVGASVAGTPYLLRRVARDMRRRGQGRILIASLPAESMADAADARHRVRPFFDSFLCALREELDGSGVTVTRLTLGQLEPFGWGGANGAVAGRWDGDGPAGLARLAFDAMMRGEPDVVCGAPLTADSASWGAAAGFLTGAAAPAPAITDDRA